MNETSLAQRLYFHLETTFWDVRYSLRTWFRDPGFVAVILFVIALGIGANTAIFSLIDALLFRSLPVSHPEQLAAIYRIGSNGEGESFSYPAFRQIWQQNQVFEGSLAFAYPMQSKVSFAGQDHEGQVQFVTANYFSVLGIHAVQGNLNINQEQETNPDGTTEPVAVISYAFWNRQFGLDHSIIGKKISIDDTPLTIVGVAESDFSGVGLEYSVDVWTPIALQPQIQPGAGQLKADGIHWIKIMGRLKPGVSGAQATANLSLIYQQYLRSIHASVLDLDEHVGVDVGGSPVFGSRNALLSPLLLLMVLVSLVLLMACVNVAGLLLARASKRQGEMGIKLALGANRKRLVRQLLTESVLLAVVAGGLGVWFAYLGNHLLLGLAFRALGSDTAPPLLAFTLNVRVMAFIFGAAILSGVLFGLAPALRSSKGNLGTGLRAGTALGSPKGQRLEKSFVTFEFAMSFLLLVVTGLFTRSFANLWQVDLGYDPKNVVEVWINLPRQKTVEQRAVLATRLHDSLKVAAGVESASMSVPGPFSHSTFTCQGFSIDDGKPLTTLSTRLMVVTPEFFSTIKVPVLQGRAFQAQDTADSTRVIIVNQTAASRFFSGQPPVGRQVKNLCGETGNFEVVGVVKDAKYENVMQASLPTFYYLLPQSQGVAGRPLRVFEIRGVSSIANVSSVRRVLESQMPGVSIRYASKLTDLIDQSLVIPKVVAYASGFFGFLALLLAAVGLYGLVAYAVRQRTAEIGVRMALGAKRSSILWLIQGSAMKLVGIGIAIGSILAFVATRMLMNRLFGLGSFDVLTIGGALGILIVVAWLAASLPSWRASRVEPIAALRYE